MDTILVGRKTYDQSLEFVEYPYKGKKVSCLSAMQSAQAINMQSLFPLTWQDL